MTALVAVHTPEGFIIAADGRQMDSANGVVITEKARKIFDCSAVNLKCAWGLYGAAKHNLNLWNFDVVKALQSFTKSQENKEFSSIADYADSMATAMHCWHHITYLGKAMPDDPCLGELLAGLLVVGFAGERPQLAQVEFRLENGVFCKPILVNVITDHCGMTIASGSRAVYEALGRNKSCVPPGGLLEGRKMAHNYIWTCVHNNTRSEECAGIGGRIHIGAISQEGFKWCIPPLES